ncbi:unnamed protein product [Trichobilharzia regenti]|nr:unnamed protein product [Trichobilharzia regenti]
MIAPVTAAKYHTELDLTLTTMAAESMGEHALGFHTAYYLLPVVQVVKKINETLKISFDYVSSRYELIRGDNITEGGSSLKESEDGNVGDNVSGDNDEDDDSDSEDENVTGRHKGVSHLIEVCNPNHIKGSNSVVPSKKELIASSKAVVDPLKLQSESELAINLARLQLVRKERELAAQKLEQERQGKLIYLLYYYYYCHYLFMYIFLSYLYIVIIKRLKKAYRL